MRPHVTQFCQDGRVVGQLTAYPLLSARKDGGRFTSSVSEVKSGLEFGMLLKNDNIKENDIIIVYVKN